MSKKNEKWNPSVYVTGDNNERICVATKQIFMTQIQKCLDKNSGDEYILEVPLFNKLGSELEMMFGVKSPIDISKISGIEIVLTKDYDQDVLYDLLNNIEELEIENMVRFITKISETSNNDITDEIWLNYHSDKNTEYD